MIAALLTDRAPADSPVARPLMGCRARSGVVPPVHSLNPSTSL